MSLTAIGTAITCLAFGPALSKEHVLHYKIMNPIVMSSKEITTSSFNEISSFEEWKFTVIEDRTDNCPGTITAKTAKGQLANFKGIHTTPPGRSEGVLIWEDSEGELHKAPVECPIPINPTCFTAEEQIDGWDLL